MNQLRISVIICAYSEERWDELAAAVRSVEQQELRPHQIVVSVDHNPSLLDRVRREMPNVVVVENEQSTGLSGARNSGLRVAHGDVVAFIDDDAVADPDWLIWINAGYAEKDVIGVGGAIEPWWPTKRPGWFPQEFDWVVGCTYRGLPERAAPVRNLIGANMSFRREVFDHLGGFRSGIGRVGTRPVGCEETEFCIRARQQLPGSVFLYEPRARIRHRVSSERTTWRYFRRRCHAEGRSKVLVSRFVGSGDGLASERTYTVRTLPVGIAQGLKATVLHGDPFGVARAGAILAGVTITTVGYLVGRMADVVAGRGSAHHRRAGAVELVAETIRLRPINSIAEEIPDSKNRTI